MHNMCFNCSKRYFIAEEIQGAASCIFVIAFLFVVTINIFFLHFKILKIYPYPSLKTFLFSLVKTQLIEMLHKQIPFLLTKVENIK